MHNIKTLLWIALFITGAVSDAHVPSEWVSRDSYNKLLALEGQKNCGKPQEKIAARIYNGIESKPGQWPWVAAILERFKINGRFQKICGGVIISNRHVLTAAHCFWNFDKISGEPRRTDINNVLLRFGDVNLDDTFNGKEWRPNHKFETSNTYAIRDIVDHEEQSPLEKGEGYDISLLKTYNEITFDEYIQPICLPITQDFLLFSDLQKQGDFAGYGNAYPSDTRLMHTIFTIQTEDECKRLIAPGIQYKIQFCTYDPDTSVCKGDSGGAMFMEFENRYYAFGILARATNTEAGTIGKNCQLDSAAIFGYLPILMNWLAGKI